MFPESVPTGTVPQYVQTHAAVGWAETPLPPRAPILRGRSLSCMHGCMHYQTPAHRCKLRTHKGGAAQSTTVRMVGAVSSNSMCGPVFGIHESSSRDPSVCVIHAPETKGHVTNAPEAKGHVIVDQVVT